MHVQHISQKKSECHSTSVLCTGKLCFVSKMYQVYMYTHYLSKNIIVNENTLVKSIRLVGMHDISKISGADKIIRTSANKACLTKCFRKIAFCTLNCHLNKK